MNKGMVLIRIMLFIVIAFFALVVTACSQPTPTEAPQDDSWQKVQETGVLRVGTAADYPPFEYYNEDFELDGFDIALIQQVGQKLGVRVELNDYAFDGLPMAVAGGQVDVVIGALSVTPERESIANFSNIYYASTDAVLSRPEADPAKINDPEALIASRLGVQINTIYESYAQDKLIKTGLMPKQNLFVFTDISQAVDGLKKKLIDAVWLDLVPAQKFAQAGDLKILVQELNQQLYAIGMKKGADALRDKINGALTQLQNEGTLADLQVQYLGIDPKDVVLPTPVPPTPPQPTPEPPKCLDNAEWLNDLSYDDKEMKSPPVLNPGQPFKKGWRLRNTGSCIWKSGYKLAYSYGNTPAAQMGGQPILVTKDVKTGETFDFYVNLVAPVVPGTYQGFWNMQNDQNKKFGETIWVGIQVPGTATPTPKPTQTPEPSINFTAKPTTIVEGEPVVFKWSTDNIKEVYFYHEGQDWSKHPVKEDGQSEEYPPYTMSYFLRVVQKNDKVVKREQHITVNPAVGMPDIEYLTASPPQITVGECINVDWSVTGEIDSVTLIINNEPVWRNAPIRGNYPDCQAPEGKQVYTLQASGPGGVSKQQVTVDVQSKAPTETAEPDEPTPTPTLTPEPIPPEPQPPEIYDFSVAPTSIEAGQSVKASWSTGGGTTTIELVCNDEVILTDNQLNNSVPITPSNEAPAKLKYTLKAYNNAGQVETRDAMVEIVAAPPQNPLANTTWKLKSAEGIGDVPVEVTITAFFGADGSLTGSGGCNSFTTSYVISNHAITIQPPQTTGALCGEPADSLEQVYLGLLPQAANFEINDKGKLIILNNGGQEILRFNPAG